MLLAELATELAAAAMVLPVAVAVLLTRRPNADVKSVTALLSLSMLPRVASDRLLPSCREKKKNHGFMTGCERTGQHVQTCQLPQLPAATAKETQQSVHLVSSHHCMLASMQTAEVPHAVA